MRSRIGSRLPCRLRGCQVMRSLAAHLHSRPQGESNFSGLWSPWPVLWCDYVANLHLVLVDLRRGVFGGVFGVVLRSKILSPKREWSKVKVVLWRLSSLFVLGRLSLLWRWGWPNQSLRFEAGGMKFVSKFQVHGFVWSGRCKTCFEVLKELNRCLCMERRCRKECITLSKPRILAPFRIMTSRSNMPRYRSCSMSCVSVRWIA